METAARILKFLPDQDAPSPRQDGNLGTLACWHRRMLVGDVKPKESPVDYQKALPKDALVVPVYMLDHSGVALSTRDFGDPWDSGQVGIYVMTSEQVAAAYGQDTPQAREKALQGIQAELEAYACYLNGDAWGYVIEDAQGNQLDGCWGFLGGDPIDNGMVDHLADEDLDLVPAAMEKAGLFLAPEKLEAVKAERANRRASAPRPG